FSYHPLEPLTVGNTCHLLIFCNKSPFIFSPSPRALAAQLVVGSCEIVTLDRDSSHPQRTVAKQTARCACRRGQIAGTTHARPACVDARVIHDRQWCDMFPCLDGESCNLLLNQSGWTCSLPGGRIKTTTNHFFKKTRRANSGAHTTATQCLIQQNISGPIHF
uniref:TAFA chemokine like family member 5, like n=1 Tax=Eptatretus burgeri TaxID=7764 RepID=A0A8C4Q694_EPTBU